MNLEDIQIQIDAAVERLRKIAGDAQAMERLHEIERMMVNDVLAENRHLRCAGCLAWMQKLIEKATQ